MIDNRLSGVTTRGRTPKERGCIAVAENMSPKRMTLFGRLCGATLARAHARSGDRIAIAAYLGGGDTFDRTLVTVAELYADQNEKATRPWSTSSERTESWQILPDARCVIGWWSVRPGASSRRSIPWPVMRRDPSCASTEQATPSWAREPGTRARATAREYPSGFSAERAAVVS